MDLGHVESFAAAFCGQPQSRYLGPSCVLTHFALQQSTALSFQTDTTAKRKRGRNQEKNANNRKKLGRPKKHQPEPEFHYFSRLPAELCAHIWRLTIQPRTVYLEVCGKFWSRRPARPSPYRREPPPMQLRISLTLLTPTPTPPVLQVCRESRGELMRAGYTTAGSELAPVNQFEGDTGQRRYVWINWEIDTLDTRELRWNSGFDCGFPSYASFAPLVKHLQFSILGGPMCAAEIKYLWKLSAFEKVKTICITCYEASEFRLAPACYDPLWPCGAENAVVRHTTWPPSQWAKVEEISLLDLRAKGYSMPDINDVNMEITMRASKSGGSNG